MKNRLSKQKKHLRKIPDDEIGDVITSHVEMLLYKVLKLPNIALPE